MSLPCLAIKTAIIFAYDDAGRRGHPRHHCDEYGFQPIVVFDGDGRFITAALRPAKRPKGSEMRILAAHEVLTINIALTKNFYHYATLLNACFQDGSPMELPRLSLLQVGQLIALLGGLAADPAVAQVVTTFDFNFTFVSNLSPGSDYGTFSGSFSATGGPGSYVISSLSPTTTLGSYTATLLTPNSFASNDNSLNMLKNSGYFSLGGVSFVANNVYYNLYYSYSGANAYNAITTGVYEGTGAVYAGNVTAVGAPGPIPGAGLLSLGGLALSGVATRFKFCLALCLRALRKFRNCRARFGTTKWVGA